MDDARADLASSGDGASELGSADEEDVNDAEDAGSEIVGSLSQGNGGRVDGDEDEDEEVGEWDDEEDDEEDEDDPRHDRISRARASRRASDCEPYPTNIKPFYLDPFKGIKIPRRNPKYTSGKVNRGQYHPEFHGQFGKAWKFFAFKLLTVCLFPDPDLARKFAMESWREAGKRCHPPSRYGYDNDILKNVSPSHPCLSK